MSNPKTIAKNSLYLYCRMLLSLGVSLYTSKVVLHTLGVEDFGLYSLVGGIVASFGFLSATITSANSRFISYAIGKSNEKYLKKIFSLTNTSNIIIAIFIFILCELLGTWWIDNKLVIADDKVMLAHIVFQISLISTIVSLFTSSFTALVISYERMGFYAITQVVQVLLKLLIVLVLPIIAYNSTITYAILLLLVNSIFLVYYIVYTRYQFSCTNFELIFSGDLKEIFTFSSWDLYGNFSVAMRTHGISLLQNIFFGVGINAAIGIANQVQQAVSMFASNLLFASKPQVIKSYSQGNYDYVNILILKSAKYSTLFLCIIIVPLIVELEYVIDLWLGMVPDYVITLIKWFLLFVIGANISSCMMMGLHATGKIRYSSFINGSLYLLVIPISFILFHFFLMPEIPYILNFLFVLVGANLNMIYLKKQIPSFSIRGLYVKVIIPVLLLSISNYILLSFLKKFLNNNFSELVLIIFTSSVFMIGTAWLFLVEKEVKQFIINKIWK